VDIRKLPPIAATRAAQYGLTRVALAAALTRGDVVKVGKGVVVGADRITPTETAEMHAIRVAAALERMHGIAAASFGSAALLQNLARLGRPTSQVRLTRGGGRYRRLDVGARLHVAGLPPEHVTTAMGVAVTTRPRTVIDLARRVTFRSGVVLADSAMRAGTTRQELDAVLGYCRRWPGRRKALRVADFASPLAETPLESVSRVLFHECAVPAPVLQHPVVGASGAAYRVDFYWEGFGVVGEADGLLKYDDPLAARREKVRELDIEDTGLEVVRWSWDQVWHTPDLVVAKVRRALRAGARRRTA
jgi:hypothetical protein